MVAITANTIRTESAGSVKMVTMDLTAIANAETLDIVGMRTDIHGFVNYTTDDQTQFTMSGNTLTFINGATLAGKLTVWGK